jgi:nicotinamidase-related amidase
MTVQSLREITGEGNSTASPSDSALIIIDAQNEYAEGKLKVSNAPESRKAIAALLKKYRDAGSASKIVHVTHSVPEGAPIFTPNTKLAEEYDELKPAEGEKVISKEHPSSFADTPLHDYLKEVGASKTVLVGYMVRCLEHYTVEGLAPNTDLVRTGSRLRLDDRARRSTPWL